MMGVLPRTRVIPGRAFQTTTVDYFGPVQLGERKACRGSLVIIQAYLAIFVCFTTKTIHLESVSNLTSEALLLLIGSLVDVASLMRYILIRARHLLKQKQY